MKNIIYNNDNVKLYIKGYKYAYKKCRNTHLLKKYTTIIIINLMDDYINKEFKSIEEKNEYLKLLRNFYTKFSKYTYESKMIDKYKYIFEIIK